MRTVIYGGACSVDGFIAGPNDEVDWLRWSQDVAEISAQTWSRIDTVIMGRRTYEVAVRNGVRAYPGVRNYVFSRSLSPVPDVTVVSEDVAEFVARLKVEGGSGICVMGGGQIARSLLAANLIDEIGANVQPVVLGSGIPLLPAVGKRVALELLESRILEGGCVYLLYRVLLPERS